MIVAANTETRSNGLVLPMAMFFRMLGLTGEEIEGVERTADR